MTTLFLSGGGYSGNWLPLLVPLAAIVILLYMGDKMIMFIKNRRLHRHEPITGGDPTPTDDPNSL